MKHAWLAALVVGVAGVACASVLNIPDDTVSWCSSHTGHTYCEDFDLGDPLSRMSYHAALGGSTLAIAPSDDSPPNLLDLQTPAVGPTGTSLAGYDEEFDSSGFGPMHIEADMRIVTHGRGFNGAVGFLLISDKLGGCIGVALEQGHVGAVQAGDPDACSALLGSGGTGLMGAGSAVDGGEGSGDGGAPLTNTLLGSLPPTDQWFHIKADVAPSGDGSGTFTFDVVGQLAGYAPLTVQKGTLNPAGTPLIGFSAAGLPGSAAAELQYDNITIDLGTP
jgi:hypothetical protein